MNFGYMGCYRQLLNERKKRHKIKAAFSSVAVQGLLEEACKQACLVAYLEQHLFLGADEVEGEMYPAAMVIATSVLGIAVGRRLQSSRKLGRTSWWITQSVFVAKLFMLVLPQVHYSCQGICHDSN